MISQIPSQSKNPQNYPSQQISVPFFNLGLSLESQNFLNNIWSALLFGKQKQTKRTLSDLANHLKYLETKIQILYDREPSTYPKNGKTIPTTTLGMS